MDVDEVDDVVAEEAVAHVAQGAADEEAEGELAALELTQERLAPAPDEREHGQGEEDQERTDVMLGAQPPGGAFVADVHDPEPREDEDRRALRVVAEIRPERDVAYDQQLGRDVRDDRGHADRPEGQVGAKPGEHRGRRA